MCPTGSVLGKALSAAGSVQPLLTAGSSGRPPKGCVLTARAGGEGPDTARCVVWPGLRGPQACRPWLPKTRPPDGDLDKLRGSALCSTRLLRLVSPLPLSLPFSSTLFWNLQGMLGLLDEVPVCLSLLLSIFFSFALNS